MAQSMTVYQGGQQTFFNINEVDIHSFFYDGQVKLTAGETLLYVKEGLKQAVSGDNVMLIFDFGRSPIGSSIEASDIILIEQ